MSMPGRPRRESFERRQEGSPMDPPGPPPFENSRLDPADWEAFRREARELLDACIDHLANVRSHPWQPVDAMARAAYGLGDADGGIGTSELAGDGCNGRGRRAIPSRRRAAGRGSRSTRPTSS